MFSINWFTTFAEKVPGSILDVELTGISRLLPVESYRRILDAGCGVGRVAGPLAARGYSVTGVDISIDALRRARQRAAGPRYIALDYRHIALMQWTFDAALVLWHSLGFDGRQGDLQLLQGLAAIVRPGGRMALELFHPEWLAQNELSGLPDDRGARSVRRWMNKGRCYHEISYWSGGAVDRIEFNVYSPDEVSELVREAGFRTETVMVWWDPAQPPGPDCARYQVLCVKAV